MWSVFPKIKFNNMDRLMGIDKRKEFDLLKEEVEEVRQ